MSHGHSPWLPFYNTKKDTLSGVFFVLALPIFPGRHQPSIVGRSQLNFRVRDGNGWTLALISTNFVDTSSVSLFAVSIPRFAHSAVSPLSITNASLVCDGSLIVFTYTLKTEQCILWDGRRLIACKIFVGQALGLLVPVSCIHYCTSTSGLSTRSSFWALTP